MLTYDDARDLVAALDGPLWEGPGTFYVATTGYQNDRAYFVPAGAREDLVDHDLDFLNFAPVARFVDKQTGELTYEPLESVHPRIDAMSEVRATRDLTVSP